MNPLKMKVPDRSNYAMWPARGILFMLGRSREHKAVEQQTINALIKITSLNWRWPADEGFKVNNGGK